MSRVLVLIGLAVQVAVLTAQELAEEISVDTCALEAFNATCTDGEVILVTSAWYGRMEESRCISTLNLGCKDSVVALMDKHCSGRRTCSVTVQDIALAIHKSMSCHSKDYTMYLQTRYKCVTVPALPSSCPSGTSRVMDPEGYLPGYGYGSSTLRASPSSQGHGSSRFTSSLCGWEVLAKPGQLIQLSTINFVHAHRSGSGGGGDVSSTPTGCYNIASVSEGAQNKQSESIKLCQRRHAHSREMNVYTSSTNNIFIRYNNYNTNNNNENNNRPTTSKLQYLIKYKAIGCPDLQVGHGRYAVRQSDDVTRVLCNYTKEVSYLSCEGNRWIGAINNCSRTLANDKEEWSTHSYGDADETFPYGILITVAIGVALGIFFGGILLAIVTVFRRRRNYSSPSRSSDSQCARASNMRHMTPINGGIGGGGGQGTMDKGYVPILDDRGQFPAAVATDIYPITAHLHQPGCPQLMAADTHIPPLDGATLTRTPLTHGADGSKREQLYALHTTPGDGGHLYDSTCVQVSHCHT